MTNHPNRSKHSVAKLMQMAQNRADGGDIRLTLADNRRFYAHAFMSRATATIRFAIEIKAAGKPDSSYAELYDTVNKKLAEPIAHGDGATAEAALENLIQRMADGLTT